MTITVAHQFGYGGQDVAKAMTDDRAGKIIIRIAWFSLRLKPASAGFFYWKLHAAGCLESFVLRHWNLFICGAMIYVVNRCIITM